MRRLFALALLAFGVAAGAVEAQPVQRPIRPYRGLFGGDAPADENRSRQELTLTANLTAGYEDQLPLGGPSGVDGGNPLEGGQSWGGDANLHYFHGRTARSWQLDGRAYTNRYSVVGDSLSGGDVRLQAQTDLGRTHRIDVRQSVSYQPTLVLGAYGPLRADVDPAALPAEGQSAGFLRQSSWATSTAASVQRAWTPRQSTSAEFAFDQIRYLDDVGFDSRRKTFNAQHRWALSRTSTLEGTYRLSSGRLDEAQGPGIPLTDQNVEMGYSYARRISPSRQVRISAGGGGTYVDTLYTGDRAPLQYWMPSGHGSFSVDVGRSWAVVADYRRAASVLPGVTLQSFATDSARVRADGLIGRRIETVMSLAFSNGRAGGMDENGRYESYTSTAQIRYALGRTWALSTSYQYYYYQLQGLNTQPNVPGEYGQHAVRVGITFWLPLYGTHESNGGTRRAR